MSYTEDILRNSMRSVTISRTPNVFVRVIEAAHSFNSKKASFSTWIFRIARNRCIDFIRREEKIKFISIEEKAGQDDGKESLNPKDTIVDERVDVEGTVVRASVIETVRECISESNYFCRSHRKGVEGKVINFKQKELIETLEQEVKSRFPAFKILSINDNADNGLWLTIKELNDEEGSLRSKLLNEVKRVTK